MRRAPHDRAVPEAWRRGAPPERRLLLRKTDMRFRSSARDAGKRGTEEDGSWKHFHRVVFEHQFESTVVERGPRRQFHASHPLALASALHLEGAMMAIGIVS